MAHVRQTGPGSWLCRVRLTGHPEVSRTFPTEGAARRFGRDTERELRQGRTPEGVVRGTTVSGAIDAFRRLRSDGGRDVDPRANEEFMLRHLEAHGLGQTVVKALSTARLVSWARSRAEEGAGPYTVGMEISKLATVLRYASAYLHEPWGDPVAAARPALSYAGLIGPGRHRDRRITLDELSRLMDELDPTMCDVVWFAIATAMRRGEITRILWGDVDEPRRLVLVRDRKHPRRKRGNHVWVPLTNLTGVDAWAVLQRQPRGGDRIFDLENEYVSDTFAAACKRAGVKDLHFHDLRHHATSCLFEAGLPIERVALVTGHQDWRNLRRYTHLKPEVVHDFTPNSTQANPAIRQPEHMPRGLPPMSQTPQDGSDGGPG